MRVLLASPENEAADFGFVRTESMANNNVRHHLPPLCVVPWLLAQQRTHTVQVEKQAKQYDAGGEYARHWLPELGELPTTALQVQMVPILLSSRMVFEGCLMPANPVDPHLDTWLVERWRSAVAGWCAPVDLFSRKKRGENSLHHHVSTKSRVMVLLSKQHRIEQPGLDIDYSWVVLSNTF